ncbi:MAG: hypothetical protein K6F71_02735 [Ruminococcus sp.]|uniref:hypothetical protein n=1 Tax=Ruminococcus sp. TaxID=41978 RepID=UPI0025D00C9A|nr:hypothetical protein [Ruminococcus sp.]MCR5539743.1 hypothetical protein [Ruminococcus sp.]
MASAEGELQVVDTAEAFKAAVEEGTSVKLTANIELASTVNVTKDVTIDLNNFDITAPSKRAFHVLAGTLTLTGKGTVSSSVQDEGSSVIRVGDGKDTTKTGDTDAGLYVGKDVTITSDTWYGVTVFGSKTTETVDIYGKVKVTGTAAAISGNGNVQNSGTTINIYDGAEITATGDVAIYHPQDGTLNVTGGTIIGLGGIVARAGRIYVSGGTFTCTGTEPGKVGDNDTLVPRSALVFDEVANYPGFNVDAEIRVSGGTFNTASGVAAITTINNPSRITVFGGTFSTEVSSYLAGGYIQGNSGAVCAFDNINVSDVYLLTKDVNLNKIIITNGVDATIDLNGHDITLEGDSGRIFVGTQAKAGATAANGSNLVLTNSSSTDATVNTTKGAKVAYYGKMTVDAGVTLTSSATQALWYLGNTVIDIYGSVTTDCVDNAAVSGIGNKVTSTADDSYNGVVNIYEGAEIISANENGIYQPNDGILNIYGGTITGSTGIYVKSGVVNITGGTVNGTGENEEYEYYGNGGNSTGDALVFEASSAAYSEAPVANISSGIFNSEHSKSLGIYCYKESPYTSPVVNITGGKFKETIDSSYIADGYYQNSDKQVVTDERTNISKAKITIDGGNSRNFSNYDNIDITNNIHVSVDGKDLERGTDYEIEGDTIGNDVGTYIFRIKGINDYKGELSSYWVIDATINVFIESDEVYYNPEKRATYGKSVTVTPPSNVHWGDNSCWEASYDNGETWNIASYSESYSFIALKDVKLRVGSYDTDKVQEKSVLTMSTSQTTYSGKNAIKFTFSRNIDSSKYTVKEVGVLYGTNKLAGADTTNSGYLTANLLTNGAEYGITNLAESLKSSTTIKKYVASSKNVNGTVDLSYVIGSNVTYYTNAIGYVIVRDKTTGNSTTIYSNAVSTSFNSAG